MNKTATKLLVLLAGGAKDVGELGSLLGVKKSRLYDLISRLEDGGYLARDGRKVRLGDSPKAVLLAAVAGKVDIETLLSGSNEVIFACASGGATADELAKRSGLPKAAVSKSIIELRSVGAIVKKDGIFVIGRSSPQLATLAGLLEAEQLHRDAGSGVIYRDGRTILYKVPRGQDAAGFTTGFTLFSEYGVAYHPVHDYYCEQDGMFDIQDVLLHAVLAAGHSGNRSELLIAMVFYTKNKRKMDTVQLRKRAARLGILELWLDVEAYMRKKEPKNKDMFLPWNEFVSKAELYEVSPGMYTLPNPNNQLFPELSSALGRPMTVYLFGGENMRLKSLKDSTKDCDIMVRDRADFDALAGALAEIGYRRIIKAEYLDEDQRNIPDDIFVYGEARIDLFTRMILRDMSLSDAMAKRADIRDYGMLKVGLLRNEDVFLLKAVAGREGDIEDMAALVSGSPDTPAELKHGPFNWQVVWDETLWQEDTHPGRDNLAAVFEQMSYLKERTGIVAPFMRAMRRRVIDMMVKKVLRGGSRTIKDAVGLLEGGDITETHIRNRIDALARSGILIKRPAGKDTLLVLVRGNECHVTGGITAARLGRYLEWRFPIIRTYTDRDVDLLTKEVKDAGLSSIQDIDRLVRTTPGVLEPLGSAPALGTTLDGVAAVRHCLRDRGAA